MISVLIPVFNFDVNKLVDTLLYQSRKSGIQIEIICIDDKSKPSIKKANESLRHKFSVNYVELSENIGRAKIRNWLARLARYEYLLFLDCDGSIVKDDFLIRYSKLLDENTAIYGGRIYKEKPPRSLKKRLHWTYGTKVESVDADKRNLDPYLAFMSNNFVVHKVIFAKIKFDETINGYGYEDLVFASQLQNNNVRILHVDNPVLHNGIEYTDIFLEKTTNAVKNLHKLHSSGKLKETKLLRYNSSLTKWKMDKVLLFILTRYIDKIEVKLYKEEPKLFFFSLYKLFHFLSQKYSNNEITDMKMP